MTSESGDRYILELTKKFENELKETEVYEDSIKENLTVLREAESKIAPEFTQKQTKNHVKRFKEFLRKKN